MRVREARARATLCCAFFLAGCAVGPDFQRPDATHAGSYVEAALPHQTPAIDQADSPAQALRAGNDLAHDWWTLYHSDALNQFIAAALRDNASLASSEAALRLAQETYVANQGNLLFPAVNAQGGVSRERASGAAIGQNFPGKPFSLYNAGVNVSYTFDLFGGVRRQLEALQAQADYQQQQVRAAQVSLTANIVTAVVRDLQLRDQVQALHEVEKLQRSGLEIVERRFALGAVTRTDVLAQRTALAQTVAAEAPLERQRAQLRHQLAALAGKAPSQIDLSAVEAVPLQLPVDIPVSLPSELVRQRPDILAAEALLHVASAQVGVATANLYPNITLTGNYGFTTLSASTLFKPQSVVWGLTGSLVQPVFRGGSLGAERRAAVAAFDQSASAYRQTVLVAFENVADALQALESDAQALQAQADAYAQAKVGADLAQRQFDVGAASFLGLLNAQQQYQQAAVNLAQARADRLADTAALFQALGGGWWNAPTGDATAAPVVSSN